MPTGTHAYKIVRVKDVFSASSIKAEPGSFLQEHKKVLNRALSPWQVYMMTFSQVVGTGIFVNGAYALSVAGQGGAALGFVVVGIVVFCVGSVMAEMIQLFPVANSMVEFVHTFLDEDLAVMVEAGYWLVYALFFNIMIISASNLLGTSTNYNSLVRSLITCLWLIAILCLNRLPVRIFGYVEAFSGTLKIGCIVTIIALVSYVDALGKESMETSRNRKTFGSDGISTKSDAQAIISAIALAVFPYIGIESVATMSAEAFNESKVAPAMSTLSPIVTALALVIGLITSGVVDRQDSHLMRYTLQGFGGVVPVSREDADSGLSNISAPIVAMQIANLRPKIVNILLILCALSSANTSLYVSSRALFGAAKRHGIRIKHIKYSLEGLSRVSARGRVPVSSVILAFAFFLWLTVLNMVSVSNYWNIVQLAANAACGSCVMIWASQCIAFIRFNHFRSFYASRFASLEVGVPTRSRWMSRLQPTLAVFGLLGCIILCVSGTAFMWSQPPETIEYRLNVVGVFLPAAILACCYLILKGLKFWGMRGGTRSLYVHFNDWPSFKRAVLALRSQIRPTDFPIRVDSTQPPPDHNKAIRGFVKRPSSERSMSEDPEMSAEALLSSGVFPETTIEPLRVGWQSESSPRSAEQAILTNGPVLSERDDTGHFSQMPSSSRPLRTLPKFGGGASVTSSLPSSASPGSVSSIPEFKIDPPTE